MPHSGLALMPQATFVEAALPLFDAGEVEALEWSFDTGWKNGTEDWLNAIVTEYSDAGRLTGHGVHFSLLSATWTPRHQSWLERLKRESQRYDYLHISEHFGFITAGDFHRSAPLPVPLTPQTLAIGQNRVQRLAEVLPCPLGVENLALALSKQDVLEHPSFIEQLVDPVEGFLLLDLHNIYCQLHNFRLSPTDILEHYPLNKVREIHVSGGSWAEAPSSSTPIRRDTHDDAVPKEVFALLKYVVPRCPNLKVVFLERLGDTLQSPQDAQQFRRDFMQMKAIVSDGK